MMTSKRTTPRFIIPMAALWVLCVATSVFGFHHRWDTYPDSVDLVMGNTLLAPFAIPKSFGDAVGVTAANSTRGTLLMMACFWPAALALAGIVIATRSKLCYLALATVMLIAAINWQVVASGMLGI